jgi:hypothetical protein
MASVVVVDRLGVNQKPDVSTLLALVDLTTCNMTDTHLYTN